MLTTQLQLSSGATGLSQLPGLNGSLNLVSTTATFLVQDTQFLLDLMLPSTDGVHGWTRPHTLTLSSYCVGDALVALIEVKVLDARLQIIIYLLLGVLRLSLPDLTP